MTKPERDGTLSIAGALVLVLLAGTVAAIVIVVAAGIAMLQRGGSFGDAAEMVQRDTALLALAQLAGLMTASLVGLSRAHPGVPARDALELRRAPAVTILLALGAGSALQFPLHEIANLVAHLVPSLAPSVPEQHAMRQAIEIDGWRQALTVPFAIVAVPAISEEIFFRGLLLPGLGRRYGHAIGIALSSILFGLIHVAPIAIVYATVAGVLLGLVRRWTGSLWPPIALHGAFNAVPVMLPASVVRIRGFNTIDEHVYHLPLAWVVGSLVVAGGCLWLLSWLGERAE
ncbi:MAG: CPBP family intramembrane metalloprotease [Sandaracinaceae bacterium]|nr:CPBP family intramembrane metalloprotease [Sandaracinaceae bacterium]